MKSDWIGYAALAGFALVIKYIDDTRDEKCYGGRWILISVIFAIVTGVIAATTSPICSAFLCAMIVGCWFAGKLDIREFRLIGVIVGLYALCVIAMDINLQIGLLLCIWGIASYFDERANAVADTMRQGFMQKVMKNKPLMPIVAIVAVLQDCRLLTAVLAIVSFDIFYYAISLGRVRTWIQRIDPVSVHNKDCDANV